MALAGAIACAGLAIGRIPSRENQESILISLRAIDINHASLQRDVLRARAGLLKNYDTLVSSVVKLHETVEQLRSLFPESGVETVVELDRELTQLSISIDLDEDLVERFKTENALLQNSLSLANQTLSAIHATDDPALKVEMQSSVDLGNLMMRFAADPKPELALLTRNALEDMRQADNGRDPDVATFISHSLLILSTLPSVDATIGSIQSSRTSLEAQMLQERYLQAYGIVSVRSSWIRIVLGSISVLLCLYIAVLVYRLRKQTCRLTQQLDFESLVAAIKSVFNENDGSHTKAISDCMGIIADFFDAKSCIFAIINTETKAIEDSVGRIDDPTFQLFVEWFLREYPALLIEETRCGDQHYYHNLQQSEVQAFAESTLSAGSIVATSIDCGKVALLLLEHSDFRTKPEADEIRLLGNAIDVLANGLKAWQERKEKEALEARLEHSQRLEAVGTLAGGIAHEFNNALGAILGYGEMALQQSRNPPRTRQYVREIVSSGERAKHIIDQILTFSRKRERVSRPFDVREAIAEIVSLVRLSVPASVHLSTAIVDDLPAVFGNPIELQQVVMNLCMNAAQAMEESGNIVICVDVAEHRTASHLSHGELSPGRYIRIGVEDNGSGIAKNVLPHIFEPFFTTKAKRGGTGLGLSAVHGFVSGMNGKINVESQPKKGARFMLYFPATNEAPVPLAEFFCEQSIPLGHGQLVAIAQCDNNLRMMYEDKIAALGYEAIGFSSLEGLEKYMRRGGRIPDLLMLDLDLWVRAPDIRSIAETFAASATLFLSDPERDGIDPRAFCEVTILRKPVSSNRLAATIYKMVGPDPA